ncbi:hypothetical protein [Segatella copri]|uniref:hypothetical protein n=1 Tax=Segatella copri TaxID=165179 RepID=UPI001291F9C5|nr:hypothetical protein [Segatella copri]MQM90645.1 hypothetical protein [Segatella copri]MQM96206.1 hypothetical protein [Segatella copri]MQN05370.1 hypothetical protein [Segatella copri]MQO36970.1 hypothetical protein [Segatella copri]
MESWLPTKSPTINVGDFVGNHVGDFKNGEKDLPVMKITGIIRYEGKVHVGVNIRVPEKVKHNAGMIVLELL